MNFRTTQRYAKPPRRDIHCAKQGCWRPTENGAQWATKNKARIPSTAVVFHNKVCYYEGKKVTIAEALMSAGLYYKQAIRAPLTPAFWSEIAKEEAEAAETDE